MKLRTMLLACAGAMLLAIPAVQAQTFTTADGVLSIETPNDSWIQTADPTYWFVISDGKNSIAIDHLSNGESVPNVSIANDNYPEIFQAFVSTKDEIFVVKALASEPGNLQSLMEAVGTVKVLRFGTKSAITTPAPQVSEFALRPIDATYYVNVDKLNVRSSCSTDSTKLGTVSYGDAIQVIGAGTQNGADFGWYQIQYNGTNAYVSAGFLSPNKPAAQPAAQTAPAQTAPAQSSSDQQKANNQQTSGIRPVGNAFDVTDAKGYVVATLTLYSDGLYYTADMQPYSDMDHGSYMNINTGKYVFTDEYLDYLEAHKNDDDYEDIYPIGDTFEVYNNTGRLAADLTMYSDGLFYTGDMEPYYSSGNSTFVSVNYGTELYDQSYPGFGRPDDDDFDEYDDYDTDDYDTDDSLIVHSDDGDYVRIYPLYDGTGFYVDDDGIRYLPGNDGEFHTSTGPDDVVYWP